MCRIVDLDGDGYQDLIVVNSTNGVSCELLCHIYWGGPGGLTGERTDLPTVGAYDVAAVDVNGDGRLDLVFPSAWVDHHNPGRPLPLHVYRQGADRRFQDVGREYGLTGIGARSVAAADLNGDGHVDLVVANYRHEFEYRIDSYVYWGTEDGFDPTPQGLPTDTATQVFLADFKRRRPAGDPVLRQQHGAGLLERRGPVQPRQPPGGRDGGAQRRVPPR